MKFFFNAKPGDQTKYLILFCTAIISIYGLLVYPWSNQRLVQTENLVKRRLNRIENRVTQVPEPKYSINRIQQQLKSADQQIEILEQELKQLDARFAPLEQPESINNLQLQMTTLAQQHGVFVQEMGGNLKHAAKDYMHAVEWLAAEADNPWGRPMVRMQARAEFGSLLRWSQALDQLPYEVTITRLQVQIERNKDDAVATAFSPVLALDLTLSL